MKNLAESQKEQIRKDFPKDKNSDDQYFFIPSQNEIMTAREFKLFHPNYSENDAIDDGYAIPFVPCYDL